MERIRDARGLTFVHPFDHVDTITGQGTVGLEIVEDLPEVDVVVERLGKLFADLVEALHQHHHFAEAFLDDLPHAAAGGQIRFLCQEADTDAGLRAGFALEILVDAGHDPQQSGLARAVQAEHADLGTRVEAE